MRETATAELLWIFFGPPESRAAVSLAVEGDNFVLWIGVTIQKSVKSRRLRYVSLMFSKH